jgi:hypothetical protein
MIQRLQRRRSRSRSLLDVTWFPRPQEERSHFRVHHVYYKIVNECSFVARCDYGAATQTQMPHLQPLPFLHHSHHSHSQLILINCVCIVVSGLSLPVGLTVIQLSRSLTSPSVNYASVAGPGPSRLHMSMQGIPPSNSQLVPCQLLHSQVSMSSTPKIGR